MELFHDGAWHDFTTTEEYQNRAFQKGCDPISEQVARISLPDLAIQG